jgi:hypothetical protein
LDNSIRSQKKPSINANLFGNSYNSSVKTLSILNKSRLEDSEVGKQWISGKMVEKPQ